MRIRESQPYRHRVVLPQLIGRLALPLVLIGLTTVPAHATTVLQVVSFVPDISVEFGAATVNPLDVARDGLGGAVSVIHTVPIVGTPSTESEARIDAYDELGDGDLLLSFDIAVLLPSGVSARRADVVRFDGAAYSVEFDAFAQGVPQEANVDAVSMRGRDLLLSFDTSVLLGGLAADDEDIVSFDGASYSMLFDGSASGVPPELDVDAVYYLDTVKHLFMSFDSSGSVGGVEFSDEDVLEYDPVGDVWELAYDGSAAHPE